MDVSDAMRSDILSMAESGGTRFVCPFCNASHERSFTVRRDQTRVWFRCWRAKCGVKGNIRTNGVISLSLETESDDVYRLQEYEPLPKELLDDLHRKYDISVEYLRRQGIRYDPYTPAICLPLRCSGQVIGWQKRWLENKTIRNEFAVKNPKYIFSPIRPQKGSVLPSWVLVENLYSAYKVEDVLYKDYGVCSSALLGHYMRKGVAEHIGHVYGGVFSGKIIVLLDPDTWPQGPVDILNQLAPFPCRVEARLAPAKPKDMARDDLIALLTDD